MLSELRRDEARELVRVLKEVGVELATPVVVPEDEAVPFSDCERPGYRKQKVRAASAMAGACRIAVTRCGWCAGCRAWAHQLAYKRLMKSRVFERLARVHGMDVDAFLWDHCRFLTATLSKRGQRLFRRGYVDAEGVDGSEYYPWALKVYVKAVSGHLRGLRKGAFKRDRVNGMQMFRVVEPQSWRNHFMPHVHIFIVGVPEWAMVWDGPEKMAAADGMAVYKDWKHDRSKPLFKAFHQDGIARRNRDVWHDRVAMGGRSYGVAKWLMEQGKPEGERRGKEMTYGCWVWGVTECTRVKSREAVAEYLSKGDGKAAGFADGMAAEVTKADRPVEGEFTPQMRDRVLKGDLRSVQRKWSYSDAYNARPTGAGQFDLYFSQCETGYPVDSAEVGADEWKLSEEVEAVLAAERLAGVQGNADIGAVKGLAEHLLPLLQAFLFHDKAWAKLREVWRAEEVRVATRMCMAFDVTGRRPTQKWVDAALYESGRWTPEMAQDMAMHRTAASECWLGLGLPPSMRRRRRYLYERLGLPVRPSAFERLKMEAWERDNECELVAADGARVIALNVAAMQFDGVMMDSVEFNVADYAVV